MAAAARSLGGVEVPIPGADKIRWTEITLPSSTPSPFPQPPGVAPSRDAAGCHYISGEPPLYLIWRIHKEAPNVLEVFELCACRELPETGLRLVFNDALHPFCFLCKNEIQRNSGSPYLVYVLTASGLVYLLNLRSPSTYRSGSILPQNELIELNVQAQVETGKIRALAATSGCIAIGRQDGSVSCYKLGSLDANSTGFVNELRDDVGIGRLWNLMSRGKVTGSVLDMVISQAWGKTLLFVVHSDGVLRIWDLVSHTRVLNHNISSHELAGSTPLRLWVGDTTSDTNQLTLAVLHGVGGNVQDADVVTIAMYNLAFGSGDKVVLLPEPSLPSVSFKGRLIDVKIGSNKIWILKEDESNLYDLMQLDCQTKRTCSYGLQEDFIADQLFQSSEHALDDLIWNNNSIFSPMKDQISYFISSIFLRRLLQPGIYQKDALRATVMGQKKYLSDYEFQSLSIVGLKKEILTAIEYEGVAANSSSTICYWKNFCAHFFRHWCQNSIPNALLVDPSTGAVGLIRKSSVSLFRSLDSIEQLIYGTSDEHDLRSSGLFFTDNDLECEILFELLRCMSIINHQLGRAASAVFYEAIVSPIISSDDVIFHLLKILETGSTPVLTMSLISQVGVDTAWEKRQATHKSQRKFSVEMLISLHSLRAKASCWPRVLDIVEKYLKCLDPHKSNEPFESSDIYNVNSILLIQASTQVARVMFESAFDILMLLGYLIINSGQVYLMQTDLARIKVKLIPMVHELLTQWLILHFVGSTPSAPLIGEDFSSRLSSLHIDSKPGKPSWDDKLGASDFPLACLLDIPVSSDGQGFLYMNKFPDPNQYIDCIWKLVSWIVRGETGEGSLLSTSPSIALASLLLRHGQYEAAENVLLIIDAYLSRRKVTASSQSTDGGWSPRLHLLGFCLLLQAQNGLHGAVKEKKIHESVRCFFRAASGQGAMQSLLNVSVQTGFVHHGEFRSEAVWKLHYYQWAMQIFEQYGMSEASCQFALAALEQVDEVLGSKDFNDTDELPEPATTIRGRLWANVFKFTLDLKHFRDSYCAIISNPDEDSKYICLRRLVNVLCELSATKVLCDGTIPFVGLMEKVEQELAWKAERSDISSRPNLYKLLYAFEATHNNWRKAASYMYKYSVRLKKEVALNENRQRSSAALQERLHSLSTAINALQLVDPAYAWIDFQPEDFFHEDQDSSNKRVRKVLAEDSSIVSPYSWRQQYCVDIEMLEKDYILTSAQYMIALVNDKFKCQAGQSQTVPVNLVEALVQENLYDMAFTVILKFWKGSEMKRELERVFVAIAQKCCPNRVGSSILGSTLKTHSLLLPSSDDESNFSSKLNASFAIQQFKGSSQWETLELYIEKYKKLHPRLPVVVAESLLHTDPQIELPLWLVHMFKGSRRVTSWGMTGQESDPASLFRLYVDYGRQAEATNLLLEYLDSLAALRPADVINRKKMSAVWFPYVAIERLWCQLEELQSSGHMVDQCDKLRRLLESALRNHLKQVKLDSEDAIAASIGEEMQQDGTL
ncbi:hypothetical protein J5N97_003546 [Dioscorea zingiberensis]|uniref:Nuclear pore complex protein NUP160 domain-containing protein n=1 Tax=Dioscorea zingiberensis TaxID=325984 RepID=A0A9D5D4C1_9LILI|nr:hypothetical protein J5N97_003546 [Dioscorea zingiberensis]